MRINHRVHNQEHFYPLTTSIVAQPCDAVTQLQIRSNISRLPQPIPFSTLQPRLRLHAMSSSH